MLTQIKHYFTRKRRLLYTLSSNLDYMAFGLYHSKRNIAFLSSSDKAKKFVTSLQENRTPNFKETIKDIIDKIHRFNIPSDKKTLDDVMTKPANSDKTLHDVTTKPANADKTLHDEVKQKSDQTPFNGQVLLLTWSYNVKIFDLNNQQVLTQCHNVEEYIHFKNTYQSVFNDFPLPKVYSFNDSNLSYVEEMIDFVPYKLWDQQTINSAILSVFTVYLDFFKTTEKKAVTLENHLDHELLNSYRFTKSLLEKVRIESTSVYTMHGDLWLDNLLFDGKTFYIADWEYYGDHFFFSDILNVFFAEALMRGDHSYLQCFYNGDYDEKLKQLFLTTGETYNPDLKRDLLFLYILERFCKKDASKTEEEKLLMLKSYEEILTKLQMGVE